VIIRHITGCICDFTGQFCYIEKKLCVIARLLFQFARISCNITPVPGDMKTLFCDITKWPCNISLGNPCIANRQILPGARQSSGFRAGPSPAAHI
jgi:hypothetical protein